MKNPHLYPPEWREIIRPAILRRDQYKCTVCGALNHKRGYYEPDGSFVQCDQHMVEWAYRNGKKVVTVHLQIAHLDQNPSNNTAENLKTFCPRHHLAFDHAFNRLKKRMSLAARNRPAPPE